MCFRLIVALHDGHREDGIFIVLVRVLSAASRNQVP
jgi:hypothetical protein